MNKLARKTVILQIKNDNYFYFINYYHQNIETYNFFVCFSIETCKIPNN